MSNPETDLEQATDAPAQAGGVWFPRSLAEAGHRSGGTSDHLLLIGPRGSGRSTFAQQVHRLSRGSGPFVTFECAESPPPSAPGEITPYGFWEPGKRVRALLERAVGGTLFLRDLEQLSLEWQLELLRAFRLGAILPGAHEPAGYDVRVIASCLPDLLVHSARGGFSAALLEWISGDLIVVASLRERADEVIPLFRRIGARVGLDVDRILRDEPGLGQALRQHSWRGQVTELVAFACALVRARQEGRAVPPADLLASWDSPW